MEVPFSRNDIWMNDFASKSRLSRSTGSSHNILSCSSNGALNFGRKFQDEKKWSFEVWLELGSPFRSSKRQFWFGCCILFFVNSMECVPYLLGIYILYWGGMDGHGRYWCKHFRIEFLWSFELVFTSSIPHVCTHLGSLPRCAAHIVETIDVSWRMTSMKLLTFRLYNSFVGMGVKRIYKEIGKPPRFVWMWLLFFSGNQCFPCDLQGWDPSIWIHVTASGGQRPFA